MKKYIVNKLILVNMSELNTSMNNCLGKSFINKQKELYILFFDVYENFLELIGNKINCYVNSVLYFENIEKMIKKKKFSIVDCVVFILVSIYNERIKYLNNANNNVAIELEKIIISKSLFILWNDIIIEEMIEKINIALKFMIEEKYHVINKEKYGVEIIIDYTELKDINNNNIENVYNNFGNYNHLNNLRKKNSEEYIFKLFDNYDTYLFCLYYYSKKN